MSLTRAPFRVLVGVPAGDTVKTGFAYDLARLVGFTSATRPDIEIRLVVHRSSVLPEARHTLVYEAIAAESTHVLMLDSDMRFPKDALVRLLEHDQPFVAAAYPTRSVPVRPLVYKFNGERHEPLIVAPGATGLVEASRVGLGLALVALPVFKDLPLPWFQFWFNPSAGDFLGEDYFFCEHVRHNGGKVFVDLGLSLEVSHLGEWEFRHEHIAASAEATVDAVYDPS